MILPKQSPLRSRRRVQITTFSKSLTEQSHKKACDINTILKNFTRTGMLNHVSKMTGTYGDYAAPMDFHAMQTIIANAKSMFESIPSDIRTKFDNDPGKFLEFATDPENREAMLEMGFSDAHLPPREDPPPADPGVAPEPAPDPGATPPE